MYITPRSTAPNHPLCLGLTVQQKRYGTVIYEDSFLIAVKPKSCEKRMLKSTCCADAQKLILNVYGSWSESIRWMGSMQQTAELCDAHNSGLSWIGYAEIPVDAAAAEKEFSVDFELQNDNTISVSVLLPGQSSPLTYRFYGIYAPAEEYLRIPCDEPKQPVSADSETIRPEPASEPPLPAGKPVYFDPSSMIPAPSAHGSKEIYGIDLGDGVSWIAHLDRQGMPEIIRNEYSDSGSIASAVWVSTADDSYIIGDGAMDEAASCPGVLFRAWTKYAGMDGSPSVPVYEAKGLRYTTTALSALLLSRIVAYAKISGEDVKKAVVTCPHYLTHWQRGDVRRAAELAGLEVVEVLSEAVAAALYYCADLPDGTKKRVMVYHLGATSFHVCLMDICADKGILTVCPLASDGDMQLGSDNWKDCLYQLILGKCSEEYGIAGDPLDSNLIHDISQQAETLLMKLCNRDKAIARLIYEGLKTRLDITRDEFERASAHLLESTLGFVDRVLEDAQRPWIPSAGIDEILLAGRAARMPQVINALNARFGERVRCEEPDLAIIRGAAIYGGNPDAFRIEKDLSDRVYID